MSSGGRSLVAVLIALAAGAAVVSSRVPERRDTPPPTLTPLPVHPEHEAEPDSPEALAAAVAVELAEAAALARDQAEDELPPPAAGGLLSPALDPEREVRQAQKRDALAAGILLKYRARIAERHGLTLEQLAELERGGPAPAASEPAAGATPRRGPRAR
jgi:hypothetical protein